MIDQSLVIAGLPMPPTDNHLFPTARARDGSLRRVQGQDYKTWLSLMTGPHLQNKAKLAAATRAFKGRALSVDIVLVLTWDTVYTKTRDAACILQEYDAHNRVKAICDWLADALEIDDRWFFRVCIQKSALARDSAITKNTVSLLVRPIITAPATALGGAQP